jgi:hypothetical protein
MNQERKEILKQLRQACQESAQKYAYQLLPEIAESVIRSNLNAGYYHAKKLQDTGSRKSANHLYNCFLEALKRPLIYRCAKDVNIWVDLWALASIEPGYRQYLPKDLKTEFLWWIMSQELEDPEADLDID